MTYKQTFTVFGETDFPLDMLRYDRCSPYAESDSHTIRESITNPIKVFVVQIIRFTQNKRDLPTEGRWASFGWTVEKASIRTEKFS